MKIFLVRHATPDWARRDIPYDIHPGPMLAPKGEREAEALAEFLKSEGVVKLYYSPFERGSRTAQIVAALNGIPCVEEEALREWREVDEPAAKVRERMAIVFDRVVQESAEIGSIGLVSHGGPIGLLLQQLGMDKDELAKYRRKFDTTNPLPPAGAWRVERPDTEAGWNFELAFTPQVR